MENIAGMFGGLKMFDLIGEITKSKKLISDDEVVTMVQVVTTLEPQEFCFGDKLVTSDDTGVKAKKTPEFVTTCHRVSPVQKQPTTHKGEGLSPLSPLSPPLVNNLYFLKETPFTEAMIMKGVKLYGQPFSQGDLDAITVGELTIDQARKYLFLWARQNHKEYLELRQQESTESIRSNWRASF